MTEAQHPPLPATKDERVAYVAELMRSGRYVLYKTPRELRDQWGLALQTVREYATMASRLVRAERPDREEAVHVASTNAAELLDMAMGKARRGEDGAIREAVSALTAYVRVHGAEAPKQVEVTEKPATSTDVWTALRAAHAQKEKSGEEPS